MSDQNKFTDDVDSSYDETDDGVDGDELEDECGLDDDGQCSMAGSEHCDFCCPYRDSDLFAGSDAWNRKHGHE